MADNFGVTPVRPPVTDPQGKARRLVYDYVKDLLEKTDTHAGDVYRRVQEDRQRLRARLIPTTHP